MTTSQDYQKFKETSLKNQPIRRRVALADLKFVDKKIVTYAGLNFLLTNTAYKDLLDLIGFTNKSNNILVDNIGDTNALQLFNTIKQFIASNKSVEVMIYINKDKEITRISKADIREGFSISTTGYFDLFETISQDKNIVIKNSHFNTDTGEIYIDTIFDKSEFSVGNFRDEIFQSGFSFQLKNGKGLTFAPFLNRLVCANGMTTEDVRESFSIRALTEQSCDSFYRHIEVFEQNKFVPAVFTSKVRESMSTKASLHELERGIQLIKNQSEIEKDQIERFLPSEKTYEGLAMAGFDVKELTTPQKKNLRTHMTVWQLVNYLTDFGSHNYGIKKDEKADKTIQLVAGELLTGNYDISNIIEKQPF